MTPQELLDALQLKTLHLIRPAKCVKELDPTSDPDSIPYYFNGVYSFEGNQWITELTKDGLLKNFPPVEDSKPVLILVLGSNLTGRTSFVNLLVLKIKLKNNREPFLVSVDLPSRDKVQCAREMAKQFIHRVISVRNLKPADAQPFWDIFEREDGSPGGQDAPYASLFNSLKSQAGPMEGPVVFILRRGDDDGLWATCLNASRSLASYIIAETGDEYNARSANDFLKKDQRVALVVARELGLTASLEYLEYRLSRGRPDGAVPVQLAPFVRDAVQALFEDNKANAADRKPVATHSIGWLAETFDRALRRCAQELQDKARAEVSSPQLITRDFMLKIRNELNDRSEDGDV